MHRNSFREIMLRSKVLRFQVAKPTDLGAGGLTTLARSPKTLETLDALALPGALSRAIVVES
jgi:hypothetical protein